MKFSTAINLVLLLLAFALAGFIAPQAIANASDQGELIAGWMLGGFGLVGMIGALVGLARW